MKRHATIYRPPNAQMDDEDRQHLIDEWYKPHPFVEMLMREEGDAVTSPTKRQRDGRGDLQPR